MRTLHTMSSILTFSAFNVTGCTANHSCLVLATLLTLKYPLALLLSGSRIQQHTIQGYINPQGLGQ